MRKKTIATVFWVGEGADASGAADVSLIRDAAGRVMVSELGLSTNGWGRRDLDLRSLFTLGNRLYSSGTPGIAGNATLNTNSKDSAGKVTTTGTGASTIVLTFSIAFSNAPACTATNETTANLTRAISTTTTLTINATIVTGDVISYSCLGY